MAAPDRVTAHPDWRSTPTGLVRELSFRDGDEAIRFADRVAALAVDYQRRPELDVSGNRVRIIVSNLHDAGVTDAEIRLARKVDRVIDEAT